jgi:hypothetical protein
MQRPALAGLTPGTEIGGAFVIERLLGAGGMGAVYVAWQKSTNRRRALKLMHGDLAADPRQRERFVQEALVSAEIDSEHVVEVVDAGIDDATGVLFLAMELLAGHDLDEVVRTRGPLAPAEVVRLFAELCHALAAAHAKGIVHRDLKPENLFLADSRRAAGAPVLKVLDFGIAKIAADRTMTSATATVGTPSWMAPEQAEYGKPIGPSADIWALGLVAFFLLTGRSYWKSANAHDATPVMVLREVALAALVPASTRAHEVGGAPLPPAFDAWFARCVARDPRERFWTVGDAFAGLESALLGPGISATAPSVMPVPLAPTLPTALAPTMATPAPVAAPPPTAAARRGARGKVVAALVAVTTVGLAAAGVFAWRPWADASRPTQKKRAKAVASSSGASSPAPPEKGDEAPPAPFGAGSHGPLYIAVNGTGILRLDGDGARVVLPLKYGIGSMSLGPGGIWAAGSEGVFFLEGDHARKVSAEPKRYDAIVGLSPMKAHAVGFEGVYTFAGGSVVVEPKSSIPPANLLYDIAVGPAGTLFVVSEKAIHYRKNDDVRWYRADVGELDDGAFFYALVATTSGRVYAGGSKGVLAYDGGDWRAVPGDYGFVGVRDLAAVGAGIVVGIGYDHFYRLAGDRFVSHDIAAIGLRAGSFRALAPDGSGRTWLATDYGLAVVDAQGARIAQWEPGTLAGVNGAITAIVAPGKGPLALPPVGAQLTGTVVGKVTRAGQPVSGAEVELCPAPARILTATPCARAPFARTAKTAADGSFTLTDVPIGSYGFAYRAASSGDWTYPVAMECCSRMAPASRFDVGALALD